MAILDLRLSPFSDRCDRHAINLSGAKTDPCQALTTKSDLE